MGGDILRDRQGIAMSKEDELIETKGAVPICFDFMSSQINYKCQSNNHDARATFQFQTAN